MDQEPSIFRLPDLVEDNLKLLGRYNVIAGLLLSSSSTPPSPSEPPAFPSFPPASLAKQSQGGLAMIMPIVAALVAVSGMGVVHVFYFDMVRWKARQRGKDEVVQAKSNNEADKQAHGKKQKHTIQSGDSKEKVNLPESKFKAGGSKLPQSATGATSLEHASSEKHVSKSMRNHASTAS